MSSSQSPFHSEHPGGYPSLHSLAPPLQTMTTSLGHGLGAAFGRLSIWNSPGGWAGAYPVGRDDPGAPWPLRLPGRQAPRNINRRRGGLWPPVGQALLVKGGGPKGRGDSAARGAMRTSPPTGNNGWVLLQRRPLAAGGHRGRSPLYQKWAAGGFRSYCGAFRRLWAAGFFLSDQKETKESPGDGSDWTPCVQIRLTPGPPLRGTPSFGCLVASGAGDLRKAAAPYSLPLCLISGAGGSTGSQRA